MYALFPAYVIYSDDYNTNTDVMVLLSQLNLDASSQFIATFLPLFVLSTRSTLITRSTVKLSRDKAFYAWKESTSGVKQHGGEMLRMRSNSPISECDELTLDDDAFDGIN